MTEIKEYLAMIAAAVSVIVWLVRLEGRVKGQADRLDRHEARMASLEASQHQQAVQLARIEEALSGIKLTLDRTYQQVSELGRANQPPPPR